jgi:Family of unknown function (DUF5715)
MSAPLPMCRTLIFVLALAALAGTARAATPAKTKPQRTPTAAHTTATAKAPRTSTSSSKTSAKSARRTSASRTSARSRASAKPITTSSRKASAKTRTAAAVPARHSVTDRKKQIPDTDSQPQRSIATAKPIPASANLNVENMATLKPTFATISAHRSRRSVAQRASLRVAMPPPLRGSLAILENQNSRLESEGMERIVDDDDLNNRIAERLLVPVPESDAVIVNPDLPENRRYCRSWTAQFVEDLAEAHAATFHKPIVISSAVRTIEYQKHLMRTNHNAAPAEGDIVSPHVMGATIDIAKRGLNRQEIAWLRNQLASQVAAGNIDVEEEFRQACFHITVYRSYAEPTPVTPPAVPESTDTPAVGQ